MGTAHPLFGVEANASSAGVIVEGSKTGRIGVGFRVADLYCNACGHHIGVYDPNDQRLRDGVETLCPSTRCPTNQVMHLSLCVPRATLGLT